MEHPPPLSEPPLVRTANPEQDESFLGYILRLTQLKGYASPGWILELADVTLSATHNTIKTGLKYALKVVGALPKGALKPVLRLAAQAQHSTIHLDRLQEQVASRTICIPIPGGEPPIETVDTDSSLLEGKPAIAPSKNGTTLEQQDGDGSLNLEQLGRLLGALLPPLLQQLGNQPPER
ncbi:MAG: hypothetical protein H7Y22_06610 [Gemmatimonadaceae bacterium]|nr:hypothetical protein [Gloeobacterales cyanobacterium ES-bin-141]